MYRQNKHVINALLSYLVDAGYLRGNPLSLIRRRNKTLRPETGEALAQERFQTIQDDFPQITVVSVRDDNAPEWTTPWKEALKAEPELPACDIAPDDDACIFYTPGTTGYPKGAQRQGQSSKLRLSLPHSSTSQPITAPLNSRPTWEVSWSTCTNGTPARPYVSLSRSESLLSARCL